MCPFYDQKNKQIKVNTSQHLKSDTFDIITGEKNWRRMEDKYFLAGVWRSCRSLYIFKNEREKISSSGQWQTVLISFCDSEQQKQHLFKKCFQVMISRSHPTYHYVRIFFSSPLEAGFASMLLSRIPKVHSQCQTTIKFSVM